MFDPKCCGSWRQSNQIKCGKDQGGCENNEDCIDGLICGAAGKCPKGQGFPATARCCTDDKIKSIASVKDMLTFLDF